MTTIKCLYKDGHIISLEVKGHTGYDRAGYDILCASVSAITQTALLGLKNVLKVKVEYKIRDSYLKMELPDMDSESRKLADAVLDTMLEGLKDIASGYSSYIKLEEEKNVY